MRLTGRLALLLVLVAACKTKDAAPAQDPADHVFGGTRPVTAFFAPRNYDAAKPAPLVLVLHGYGASGAVQSAYFGLGNLVDEEGFFLAAPDGTADSTNRRFWNATDTCCDFDRTGVDDVRYLTDLVTEISSFYPIDPKRIYVLGHSNGGSMAFRLACDATDRFAAIVDLAGPFYSDPGLCHPKSAIAVRHMHGTADVIVPYDGGPLARSVNDKATGIVPSAVNIAKAWAGHNGCSPVPDTSAAPIDLELSIAGSETRTSRYTGCRPGGDVELWSIEGAPHVPLDFAKDLPRRIYDFFKAHPKTP